MSTSRTAATATSGPAGPNGRPEAYTAALRPSGGRGAHWTVTVWTPTGRYSVVLSLDRLNYLRRGRWPLWINHAGELA